MELDEIVARLSERKQRATYSAVAGVVGVLPRGLMIGRRRQPIYSWVVAASGSRRGWPTGYTNEEIDPDCLRQIREHLENIIQDADELNQWLRN